MAAEYSDAIMQIVHIPVEQLEFDYKGESGKSNFMRVYDDMSEKSKANIKITYAKDKFLTFLVKGGLNEVLETRHDILTMFQSQIQIPHIQDQSEIIDVTNTKDVREAELALKLLSDERANIVSNEIAIPSGGCDSPQRTRHKLSQSIVKDCSWRVNAVPIVSTQIRVEVQYHKFLIGKNGTNIKKISESTGAQIVFPSEKDKDKEVITIIGNEDAVDEAKAELESTIMRIGRSQYSFTSDENKIAIEISIDPKYHAHFLVRRGEVLHKIIEECGEVTISFPHTGVKGDRVVIKGARESVSAAKKRLLDIVNNLEPIVTIECEIPRKYRFLAIGSRGCNVRAINAEFDVWIKFPDRFAQDEYRPDKQDTDEERDAVEIIPDYDVVRITGQPDNAEAAKQALLRLVPITIKVDVPNIFHCLIIGKGGRDVRELMERYDVRIELSRPGQNFDYVTISGTPQRVNEAKQAILDKYKILEAARQERELKSYKLKIEVDSEYHPKIIECSGTVIQKIISDNDVAICFPRIGDSEDNIITIIGCEKNVHHARDGIMKIINELTQKPAIGLDQVQEDAVTRSCESPTPSIESDIIGCEVTDLEKRSQDLSNDHREFVNAEDDEIECQREQVEGEHIELPKLYEKLSVSCNSMSSIQEHTNVITDALKYCENSQERLTELQHNNEVLQQESQMKDLREKLNELVSMNETLKNDRTQLTLEIENRREMYERLICEKEEKYNKEIAKLSETINDIEIKLNVEQEEKSKLVAEKNESSKRFNELLSKHQALEVTSSEYKKEVEYLKLGMEKLKENETRLTNELCEMKRTYRAAVADEELQQTGHKKQLEDLTLAHEKTINKLSELATRNTEFSKTVSKRDQDIALLETASKAKDYKISELNRDLSDALGNSKNLSDIIKSLKGELDIKEEEIYQVKRNFETYKAIVDEDVLREKENHEAKLNKMRSTVRDLMQKLVEIAKVISNSPEICEMLNEGRSTNSSRSDNVQAESTGV